MSSYIVYTPAINLTETFNTRNEALACARDRQEVYDTYIYRLDSRCLQCNGTSTVCGNPRCEKCYGPNPRIADPYS